MTISVPILGSRAREQLPGTSITLRATGFRGEMSRFEGAKDDEDDPLPLATAVAGADVMLASRLDMQIEAPARDDAGLRTRSAVATQPQLIVPRRPGIAYALLQTDADGRSQFVLPLPGDTEEAVFPLHVDGAAQHALRVLMWPGRSVLDAGSLESTAQWERFRRPNYITNIGPGGKRSMPDWGALDDGPVLLLLHGTFGTPESAFGAWFADPSFRRLVDKYEGRCVAFAHPTLATSIPENLDWLLAQLPARQQPVDIVGHGRGGLLARALVNDGRLPVRRVCQVGSPNHGTPLAREPLAWLNGHVAMLAALPTTQSLPTLEGVLALMRSVALGAEAGLPGVGALVPESFADLSPASENAASIQWLTIGAHFLGQVARNEMPTDLGVGSEDCHRPGPEVADSLRLFGNEVHHHNYFTDRRVRERLADWLCA